MMDDEFDFPRDDAERAWLAALPTESAPLPDAEERLVRSLRAAGALRRRPAYLAITGRLAAAIVIFLAGAAAGAYVAGSRRAPSRTTGSAGPARVVATTTTRDSSASSAQHIITWY